MSIKAKLLLVCIANATQVRAIVSFKKPRDQWDHKQPNCKESPIANEPGACEKYQNHPVAKNRLNGEAILQTLGLLWLHNYGVLGVFIKHCQNSETVSKKEKLTHKTSRIALLCKGGWLSFLISCKGIHRGELKVCVHIATFFFPSK